MLKSDDAAILAAARALRAATRVVVATGAGMSQESGIPTFRDSRTGLWALLRSRGARHRGGVPSPPGAGVRVVRLAAPAGARRSPSPGVSRARRVGGSRAGAPHPDAERGRPEIGRASCRERV